MPEAIVWSDLHHDLKADAKSSVKLVINAEAVVTSIQNILNTSPGERVMRPTFGAGLKLLVFEPTRKEELNRMAEKLKDKIEEWDNRVLVNSVDFFGRPDDNSIRVQITFSIRGYSDIFHHSVLLDS